jgi:cytochrome oxidase Cu insertion factor (SCO1/SenC/PrrC family)
MRALAAAAFLALAIVSAAAQPAPMPDLATVGPQVGAQVPSFTLPDQTGQSRSLESLIRPKGAILVFFRSADW